MSAPDRLLRTLKEQLEREEGLMAELESALEAESSALARRDATPLDEAVARKQAALEGLGEAVNQRLRWMQSQGLEAGLEGIRAAAGETDPDLPDRWEALAQRLEAAQQQNEINGQILEATRQGVEELLTIFRSPAPKADAGVELYTAGGRSGVRRGPSGGSLTQA
ncbi:flagella synthesis protein FlgN [Thiohalospira halophila DSM 15071]|uniref:Flagella synthesis protein FlgN n=1 Tax=Thiohalospira halophila DSM 15071 TaxID=1123397 RepID=A0A1I1WFV2_9GAMM|nr:flagellar protein FlgN [Thiohalospira halophila]SFD92283.1 flagella synthesis protein FlgN [Thiohalospira halophila DSM 15071]